MPGNDRTEDESYRLRSGAFWRLLGALLATIEPQECQNYMRNSGVGSTYSESARVVPRLSPR